MSCTAMQTKVVAMCVAIMYNAAKLVVCIIFSYKNQMPIVQALISAHKYSKNYKYTTN